MKIVENNQVNRQKLAKAFFSPYHLGTNELKRTFFGRYFKQKRKENRKFFASNIYKAVERIQKMLIACLYICLCRACIFSVNLAFN